MNEPGLPAITEADNNPAEDDCHEIVVKSIPPEKQGFVSQWVDLSVEQAVVSGVKLRDKKQVCTRQQNTINLAAEDEDVKKRTRNRSIYKPRFQRPIRNDNCVCTPRSCSPYQRLISSGTYTPLSKNIFSRPGTASSASKTKKARKCPLRIAELAEPSKRHCIETWRNKNNALPPFMLDRLKQHVMNQRPIARIPDAINCFKRKQKCFTGSKKEEKMLCRARRHAQREAQEMLEMKKLCAIFAQKLAKRLIKPKNICLNNEMEILSNIVAIEINKIISNKNTIFVDYINDTVILKEMSSKVAIWIAGILDDAYYKLIDDDLRDLEEEEGPALDVLDTIVDKVVQMCTKNSEADSNSEGPADGKSEGVGPEPDESEYDTGNESENSAADKNDDDNASRSEKSTERKLQVQEGLFELPKGTLVRDDEKEKVEEEENEKDPNQSNFSTVELNGTEGDIKSLLNALLNEASLNVSEVFVVVSQDPVVEGKTVKFSKVDNMVVGGHINKTKPPQSGTTSPITRPNVNIVFAPPNNDLLYEADESWPDAVIRQRLPNTASVSKSVTSLGLIFESDEKSSIVGTGNDDSGQDKTTNSENEQYIKIIDELNKRDDNERTLTPTDTSDDGLYSKINKGGLSDLESETDVKNVDSNKESEKNLDSKSDYYKKDGKGDCDTDDDRNIMLEAIRQKMNTQLYSGKPKFDYKVHPHTAPAWVNCNCIPSDESTYEVSTSKKQMVAQRELRKWCKDLENTLINLQQWNYWIDTTCKKILSLKQATEMNNIFASDNNREIKEWLKLKRNIDKDAILWRKLSKRTTDVLHSYTITFNPKPEDGDKAREHPHVQESIFDTINRIDELSLWLHRLIVSTEYCVKCNCKKYTKRSRKFVCSNTTARQCWVPK